MITPVNIYPVFLTQFHWKSCHVNEFVNNSEVFSSQNGLIYFISNFSSSGSIHHSRFLRVLNPKSGQWYVSSLEYTKVQTFIEGTLFFIQMNRKHGRPELYRCDYNDEKLLVKVPEWATHFNKKTLTNGKALEIYSSRKRAEIRYEGEVILYFNEYLLGKIDIKGSCYMQETGIVANIKVINDKIAVSMVDKTAPLAKWHPYGVDESLLTIQKINNLTEKKTIHGEEVDHNYKEIWEGRVYDCDGNEVEPSKKEREYLEPSIPYYVIADEYPEFISVATESQSIKTYVKRGWNAVWSGNFLTLSTSSKHEVLFRFKTERNDQIDNVFFYNDLIIVLTYELDHELVESDFHYCSGPICYSVNIMHRSQYTFHYCDPSGKVLKTHKIHDFKQDFNGHSSDPHTKFIAASLNSYAKINPDASLTIHNFDSNDVITYQRLNIKKHNDNYLVRKDDKIISLISGIEVVCSVPKPWTCISLCGPYLAIANPERTSVVNLQNDRLEFIQDHLDIPKSIAGFSFKDSPQDFLAVEYEKYMKIWHKQNL
jgi:hypothetical protein